MDISNELLKRLMESEQSGRAPRLPGGRADAPSFDGGYPFKTLFGLRPNDPRLLEWLEREMAKQRMLEEIRFAGGPPVVTGSAQPIGSGISRAIAAKEKMEEDEEKERARREAEQEAVRRRTQQNLASAPPALPLLLES